MSTNCRSHRTRATVAAFAASALVALGAQVLFARAAGATDAGNESEFTTAWENDATTDIALTADITLTCDSGTPFRDSDSYGTRDVRSSRG